MEGNDSLTIEISMKRLFLIFLIALEANCVEIDRSDAVPIQELLIASNQYPLLSLFYGSRGPAGRAVGRITGGEIVKPGEIPHQVGLFLQVGQKTAFCGGSVITKSHVLTAAHCLDINPSGGEVVFGAWNITDKSEATQVSRKFSKGDWTIHEKWSKLTLLNDLAVIKLKEEVNFNDNIQPISLPTLSQQDNLFTGKTATVSGWGKDSDSANSITSILRHVEVPVISNTKCGIFYFFNIKNTHICGSGSGGKSSCNGDSGGPLTTISVDGKKRQIGVVSFGIAFGCEKGWPSVYTRLTEYLSWISEKTGVELEN